MKKLIKKFRDLVSSIDQDVKDHLLITVAYLFMVVQWAALCISKNAGIIAIGIGFVGAVAWEIINNRINEKKSPLQDSVKDVLIYVLVSAMYLIALLK